MEIKPSGVGPDLGETAAQSPHGAVTAGETAPSFPRRPDFEAKIARHGGVLFDDPSRGALNGLFTGLQLWRLGFRAGQALFAWQNRSRTSVSIDEALDFSAMQAIEGRKLWEAPDVG